jgi:RNA polymerase sigma-70 factor (ECF subfamily)
MEVSDAAVVSQVLAGDQDAFRVLVERHSRSIYAMVHRMTGSPHDTEEIIQEVFLRAYTKLKSFELRSSFATWLYRIAVNRTLDFLSAKKMNDTCQIAENPDPEAHGEQVQLRSGSPGPDRLLLSTEIESRIADAMKRLTPVEHMAFTLRHLEGKSIEEISQVLNLRADAAKNSIYRAVQKLRHQLAPLVSVAK